MFYHFAKTIGKWQPGRITSSAGSHRLLAWRWLFPLAAVHAALMVPLALLAAYHAWPLRLATPAAHAREMLFGFALAVIAGYLLGPVPRRRLLALALLWLAGRLSVLEWPGAGVAALADGVFVVWVALLLVPRFMAARKWRNRLLSPLLGLICLLALVTLAQVLLGKLPASTIILHHSVLWLVLLMVFMGGRFIAPAVNGYMMRTFRQPGAGVQPHIEAGLILLLGLANILMLWAPLRPWAALLPLVAAGLIMWRIFRWQPLRCRTRPDLLVPMLGYGWLAIGLILVACSWWAPEHTGNALHAFTVGALGTLASSIMLRHVILRARHYPEREWSLWILAGLFALAAMLRLWAFQSGSSWLVLLWGSALAWSLAWWLVAWRLCVWIVRLPERNG